MPHITLRPPVTVRTFVTAVNPLYAQLNSAEVIDVLDELPATPTANELIGIVNFVDQEVIDGRWGTSAANYTDSLYDVFWCFALLISNALTSWHPLVSKTAVNNGAIKIADGFSTDGISQYIDMDYEPSVDGVKYLLNDAQVGCFFVSPDSPFAGPYGTIGGAGALSNFMITTPRYRTATNSTLTRTASQDAGSNELFIQSRIAASGSDSVAMYVDGVNIDPGGDVTSTALPTGNIFVGARNNGGTAQDFAAQTVSTFIAGASIGFNQVEHNTNIVNLLTDLGVLP